MTGRGADDRQCFLVRLTGRAQVFHADGAPVRFPTRKALALFIYLARMGDAGAARDDLAERFWPGRPDRDARRALRGTLHEMRRALKPSADRIVQQSRHRVSIDPTVLATDIESGNPVPKDTWDRSGDFLVGLEIGTPGFDQWCRQERARLRDDALNSARAQMEADLVEGRFDAAQRAAEHALALDPMGEPACRGLMRALSGLGRRAEALRHYTEFRDRLAAELDTVPEAATERLPALHKRAALFSRKKGGGAD